MKKIITLLLLLATIQVSAQCYKDTLIEAVWKTEIKTITIRPADTVYVCYNAVYKKVDTLIATEKDKFSIENKICKKGNLICIDIDKSPKTAFKKEKIIKKGGVERIYRKAIIQCIEVPKLVSKARIELIEVKCN